MIVFLKCLYMPLHFLVLEVLFVHNSFLYLEVNDLLCMNNHYLPLVDFHWFLLFYTM